MSALLHVARQIQPDLGPYDTARRRRARLSVPVEVRRAASRAGGFAKAAKVGSAGMVAMGRLGGAGRVPVARRLEVCAMGAMALNALLTPAQKRAYGRLGGLAAAKARRG